MKSPAAASGRSHSSRIAQVAQQRNKPAGHFAGPAPVLEVPGDREPVPVRMDLGRTGGRGSRTPSSCVRGFTIQAQAASPRAPKPVAPVPLRRLPMRQRGLETLGSLGGLEMGIDGRVLVEARSW